MNRADLRIVQADEWPAPSCGKCGVQLRSDERPVGECSDCRRELRNFRAWLVVALISMGTALALVMR